MKNKKLKISEKLTAICLVLFFAFLMIISLTNSEDNISKKIQSAVINNEISKVDSILSQNTIDLNDEELFEELPLFVAVGKGYVEMLDLLIDKGANINEQVYSVYTNERVLLPYTNALEVAILKSPKMIDRVIEKGYIIDPKSYKNPLLFALKYNSNIEVVKSLIKHGIYKDYTDDYNANYLHYAAQSGSKEVYDYLLTVLPEKEKEKTKFNETMIHFAASSGNLEFFKYILSRGFTVDEKVRNGQSILHFVGSEAILKYILDEFSFDVNERDDLGRSAIFSIFMIEDKEERKKVLRLLIESGADINAQTVSGASPIHEAAALGDYECVKLLIDNGIDVNVSGTSNHTALHILAGSNNTQDHPKIVKLLLDSGADKTIMYNNSMTALEIAKRANNKEIIDLLK